MSVPLVATHLPALKLPKSAEEWSEVDRVLTESVVPAVLAATTVDDKNDALCQGIYQLFANQFGCASPHKPRRQRKHARRLKRLTFEKNQAKKQLRQAKASSGDPSVLQDLARRFY